jgi:hypothetical protein
MATQRPGLIVLDVGILMGSQSEQVFREMLDLYPGAQHLMDVVCKIGCECGKESCGRQTFQLVLEQAIGSDRELAAAFIEEAQRCHEPYQVRELEYEYYQKRQISLRQV